jgi:hypothetical protein
MHGKTSEGEPTAAARRAKAPRTGMDLMNEGKPIREKVGMDQS